MKSKVTVTKDELKKHLREQFGFLVRSSQAYDQGYKDEAKRISVVLRVLFHDTENSKSLLGQMGVKQKISILDTAAPIIPGNMLSYSGLTAMHMGGGVGEYVPLLNGGPRAGQSKHVFFEKWWNAVVVVDQKRNTFKRRELILALANKDGGAHVDPALDDAYAALTRSNSMGWVMVNGAKETPILPIELASVRQIAYEVTSTFQQKMSEMFE